MQNQNNLWFYERFGSSVQQQNVRKENKNKKIYNEINGELAKRLSIRRHEELERRYSFYNVENEIFEEHHKSGVQDEENDSEEEVEMNDSATTKYDGSPKMKRQKFDYLEGNQINNPDKDEIQKVDENKQEETNDEDAEIDNSIDEEEEIEELNQEDEENKEYEECYDEDDEQDSDHSLEKTIVKKRRIIEDDDNDDEEKMKEEKIEEQEGRDEQQNFTKENDLFTCEDEVNEITENLESFIDQEAEAEMSDLDEIDENEEDLSMLTPTPQNRKDLLDDEASLSGDDVGSDADDNDQIEGMDEYEAEEGDLDELPEDEEIRDNLVRQYMKHQKDADDRKLLKLQEAFFADSDLHGKGKSGDRSFRLRMHDDSKVDWAKILGTIGEKDDEIEKEEEDEMKSNNWNERRAEMLKWKLEEEKKRHQRGDHDHEEEDEFGQQNVGQDQNEYEVELNELEAELAGEDCKLFKLGEEILGRIDDYYEDSNVKHSESSNSMSNKQQKTTFNRDSLLTKATCLENLLKEGKCEKSSSTSAALFTTQK